MPAVQVRVHAGAGLAEQLCPMPALRGVSGGVSAAAGADGGVGEPGRLAAVDVAERLLEAKDGRECAGIGEDDAMNAVLVEFVLQAEPDLRKKTKTWTVTANGQLLGEVKWWSAWRRYCFQPYVNTIYDHTCLIDIATFCHRKTKEHGLTRKIVPK